MANAALRECVLIGVPYSGKSTFLGALRHLLIQAPTQASLRLLRLGEDDAHLNALEAVWAECEEPERTKIATEAWVAMHTISAAGEQLVLHLPDLRGEAFEDPACHDACDARLAETASRSDGILLLTSADAPDGSHLIEDFNDIIDGYSQPDLAEGKAGIGKVFDPKDMAEEAKLVEFLQFLNRRPNVPKRRKLAVLISAWDVVADETSPMDWLTSRRPMLSQFLESKSGLWDLRIYGVSAQGGAFPEKKAEMRSKRLAYERIKVVGHEAADHDLSAPLYWLSKAAS